MKTTYKLYDNITITYKGQYNLIKNMMENDYYNENMKSFQEYRSYLKGIKTYFKNLIDGLETLDLIDDDDRCFLIQYHDETYRKYRKQLKSIYMDYDIQLTEKLDKIAHDLNENEW